MSMKRTGKACCNCAHYKSYYTKSTSRFYKENKGVCSRLKEQTGCWESCAQFESAPKLNETQKKSIMRKLNELCDEIVEMKQVLSELTETDGQ